MFPPDAEDPNPPNKPLPLTLPVANVVPDDFEPCPNDPILENVLLVIFEGSAPGRLVDLNGFAAEANGLVSKVPAEDDELNGLIALSETALEEFFATAVVVLVEDERPLVKVGTTEAPS